MLIEQPGIFWIWVALHVTPPFIAAFRSYRRKRKAVAAVPPFLFFAFIALVIPIAEMATIYYLHTDLVLWGLTIGINLMAFVSLGKRIAQQSPKVDQRAL